MDDACLHGIRIVASVAPSGSNRQLPWFNRGVSTLCWLIQGNALYYFYFHTLIKLQSNVALQ